ncbi:MAG: WD40 repeat domain-containing protein [Anaerolineaceae bacterium]|nr:WD40 repeat domain-containing protein [Anaerolineaceae bacterium]
MNHRKLGKIALLLLCCILPACRRSATPPYQPSASPPALPRQTETQPTPTDAPAVLPSPTTVVLTTEIKPIEPENATLLRQGAEVTVENPAKLVWSQNSNSLAVMSGVSLIVLQSPSLKTAAHVEISEPIYLLDFSPTSDSMATTVDQQKIELRQISSGQVLRSIQFDTPILTAHYSPDGNVLAAAMSDGIAYTLWDVRTGQFIKKLSGFETAAPVYGGFFSPDGREFIWVARGTVQIMNIETGVFSPAIHHEDFVSAAALSPDGQTLATAAGGTLNGYFQTLIYLWDAHTSQQITAMPAGDVLPTSLSFSPDSKLLASSDANRIVLWDVAAGQMIGAVSGHQDNISVVAFSPDGKRLASTAYDNTVRLWQIGP